VALEADETYIGGHNKGSATERMENKAIVFSLIAAHRARG
jgi:hypothetical protein